MVGLKPSRPTEGNESKILTDGNKGQAYNPKKYRSKKPQNKPIPEAKTETDFHGQCTDLKGDMFDLGTRASDKFNIAMKELEQYLGATYSDRCQPSIMTENMATFCNQ